LNFHLRLAQATHNQIYPILVGSFYDLTEKTFFHITEFTNKSINSVNKAQEQHRKLIEAIENRDGELAVATIKAHMELFKEEIELLKSQGFI
jgi:DNA-binding FadR family transcriptional regulator